VPGWQVEKDSGSGSGPRRALRRPAPVDCSPAHRHPPRPSLPPKAIELLAAVDPQDDSLPTLYSNRSGARLMLHRPHAALGDARRSIAASRRKFVRGHLREVRREQGRGLGGWAGLGRSHPTEASMGVLSRLLPHGGPAAALLGRRRRTLSAILPRSPGHLPHAPGAPARGAARAGRPARLPGALQLVLPGGGVGEAGAERGAAAAGAVGEGSVSSLPMPHGAAPAKPPAPPAAHPPNHNRTC
jgi:hypothetical protein